MAKTALELTPEELKTYNPQRRKPRGWPKPLRARAWKAARQAARVLREEFGAKRVVVFGSLAHQLWYSPQSDIDLAAWGIPAREFFHASAKVSRVTSEFEVNLIPPEDCRPVMRRAIEEEGVEL